MSRHPQVLTAAFVLTLLTGSLTLATPAAAQASSGQNAPAVEESAPATPPPPMRQQFTEERFEQLQAEDAVILVEVFADWCPTCARQGEILNAYFESRPDSPIHTLTVDFDSQKEWVKAFKAPRQSTLILYQGAERTWFSVAETNQERIFLALDTAAAVE